MFRAFLRRAALVNDPPEQGIRRVQTIVVRFAFCSRMSIGRALS